MNQFVIRLSKNKSHSRSESASSKKHSAGSKVPPPIRRIGSKQQSYLDLGQPNLGKIQTCPLCSMAYILDDDEDNHRHRKFCKEKQMLLNIHSIRNGDIMWENAEKEHCILKISKADCLKTGHYFKQFKSALEAMYLELGSSPEEAIDPRGVVYFYLIHMRISGVVVVEQVHKSDLTPRHAPVRASVDKETSLSTSSSEGGDRGDSSPPERALKRRRTQRGDASSHHTICDNSAQTIVSGAHCHDSSGHDRGGDGGSHVAQPSGPLIIGIREVWVASQCRRQGIATKLIEVARKTYRYRAMPDVRDIAFSQPTADASTVQE